MNANNQPTKEEMEKLRVEKAMQMVVRMNKAEAEVKSLKEEVERLKDIVRNSSKTGDCLMKEMKTNCDLRIDLLAEKDEVELLTKELADVKHERWLATQLHSDASAIINTLRDKVERQKDTIDRLKKHNNKLHDRLGDPPAKAT